MESKCRFFLSLKKLFFQIGTNKIGWREYVPRKKEALEANKPNIPLKKDLMDHYSTPISHLSLGKNAQTLPPVLNSNPYLRHLLKFKLKSTKYYSHTRILIRVCTRV